MVIIEVRGRFCLPNKFAISRLFRGNGRRMHRWVRKVLVVGVILGMIIVLIKNSVGMCMWSNVSRGSGLWNICDIDNVGGNFVVSTIKVVIIGRGI